MDEDVEESQVNGGGALNPAADGDNQKRDKRSADHIEISCPIFLRPMMK